MSKMVLCIDREALQQQGIPYHTSGIFPFNLNNVSSEDFHFLNRKLVDSKDNKVYQDIGYLLPQILPYITIMDLDGNYLTYSRNGTETRLHGSRSIGIGGHIDITDMYDQYYSVFNNPIETIKQATNRELYEEVGIDLEPELFKFNKLIVDTTNSVGKVHVGLTSTIVMDYTDIQPQEELHDPQWLSVEELKANIDEYENWSKLIIEGL